MNDSPDDGHELLEADLRQVPLEVVAAARHVHAREHGAVRCRVVVLLVPQITDVVKQRADDRKLRAIGAQAIAGLYAHLVARDEARQRERHVERVLHVVIRRIDAVVVRVETAEHALEIVKRHPDGIERAVRIQSGKKLGHGKAHLPRGAHLHGVRHVVVVAPVL
jgi:hypothetical protein